MKNYLKPNPSYEHIRIFGCLCYVYNNQRQKDKFGECSKKCIFIGYPHGKKGWKLYDLESGDIFVSHDVTFHDEIYQFAYNEKLENGVLSNLEQLQGWIPNENEDDFLVQCRLDVRQSQPSQAVPNVVLGLAQHNNSG